MYIIQTRGAFLYSLIRAIVYKALANFWGLGEVLMEDVEEFVNLQGEVLYITWNLNLLERDEMVCYIHIYLILLYC